MEYDIPLVSTAHPDTIDDFIRDTGNLKFETVRTHKQHICFQDLRRSI